MLIVCSECEHEFEPDDKVKEFIIDSANKGMTFIMLECPECPLGTELDPVAFMAGKASSSHDEDDEDILRCPVESCTGYVSHVTEDEKPFWGCGECGSVWYKAENLYKEIEAVSKKYSYRKKCYKKAKGVWLASNKEPDNYEDLVEKEPSGVRDAFVRG